MTFIFFTLGLLFAVIGFPIWMCGCGKFGSPCVRYNSVDAVVTKNDCIITHGYDGFHGSDNDDTVGYNCNVNVEYTRKFVKHSCVIFRSDNDYCGWLVTSNHQKNKCINLNLEDYQLNKIVNIYVDTYSDKCFSSHYVHRLSTIGFIFFVISGLFFCCNVIYSLLKKYKIDNKQTLYTKVSENEINDTLLKVEKFIYCYVFIIKYQYNKYYDR